MNTYTNEPPTLRLNQFQRVATASQHLPDWVQFLILALLYWLEEWYIKQTVTDTVSEAITEYKQQEETVNDIHWQDDAITTVTENPDSLSQLPTLSIRVPYRTD
jgi:hypothetical protein